MSLFSGFLAVLRRHGDLSHRGPLVILVIWIAIALLSCIWLRSSILKFEHDSSHNYTNDVILVCLHSIYCLTLLFKGSSTYVQRRSADDDVIIKNLIFILKLNLCTIYQFRPFSIRSVEVCLVHGMFASTMIYKSKH